MNFFKQYCDKKKNHEIRQMIYGGSEEGSRKIYQTSLEKNQ